MSPRPAPRSWCGDPWVLQQTLGCCSPPASHAAPGQHVWLQIRSCWGLPSCPHPAYLQGHPTAGCMGQGPLSCPCPCPAQGGGTRRVLRARGNCLCPGEGSAAKPPHVSPIAGCRCSRSQADPEKDRYPQSHPAVPPCREGCAGLGRGSGGRARARARQQSRGRWRSHELLPPAWLLGQTEPSAHVSPALNPGVPLVGCPHSDQLSRLMRAMQLELTSHPGWLAAPYSPVWEQDKARPPPRAGREQPQGWGKEPTGTR